MTLLEAMIFEFVVVAIMLMILAYRIGLLEQRLKALERPTITSAGPLKIVAGATLTKSAPLKWPPEGED